MNPRIPEQYHFIGCMPPVNPKSQFKIISRLRRMNFHYFISFIPLPIYLLPRKTPHGCKNHLLLFFSWEPIPNAHRFIRKEKFFKTDSLNHFKLNSNSKTEFLHSRLAKKDTQNQKYISNTKQSTRSDQIYINSNRMRMWTTKVVNCS